MDLEGAAGFKRTKGGAGDKEPALIVSRNLCCRYFACVVRASVSVCLVLVLLPSFESLVMDGWMTGWMAEWIVVRPSL